VNIQQFFQNSELKLLVGLGNPGREYLNNRHNAGFLFLSYLDELLGIQGLQSQTNNEARLITKKYTAKKLITSTPMSYMNDSGPAIAPLLQFYKLGAESLAVAYDDLDISLGSYKLSWGKSPRSHNGINSLIETIGTEAFWHIRIGVGKPNQTEKTVVNSKTGIVAEADTPIGTLASAADYLHGHRYLLSDFLPMELEILKTVFVELCKELGIDK